MGVRLKSKWPLSRTHAESLGLIREEPRSKLRVSRAWGTRRSHRSSGKSLSMLQRPAMKWFLNVWMVVRPAVLHQW
jgi:hypothetical protein